MPMTVELVSWLLNGAIGIICFFLTRTLDGFKTSLAQLAATVSQLDKTQGVTAVKLAWMEAEIAELKRKLEP